MTRMTHNLLTSVMPALLVGVAYPIMAGLSKAESTAMSQFYQTYSRFITIDYRKPSIYQSIIIYCYVLATAYFPLTCLREAQAYNCKSAVFLLKADIIINCPLPIWHAHVWIFKHVVLLIAYNSKIDFSNNSLVFYLCQYFDWAIFALLYDSNELT